MRSLSEKKVQVHPLLWYASAHIDCRARVTELSSFSGESKPNPPLTEQLPVAGGDLRSLPAAAYGAMYLPGMRITAMWYTGNLFAKNVRNRDKNIVTFSRILIFFTKS